MPRVGRFHRHAWSRERRRTNRWTRAAGACFASSLVRRYLIEFAPPRQLRRSTAALSVSIARERMTAIDVEIIRFVDPHQPGIVECSITDARGAKHLFVEKVPVVTREDLTETSSYPRRGVIACDVLRRWRDSTDREIATVDVDKPWGIESTDGQTQFDVLVSALTEI